MELRTLFKKSCSKLVLVFLIAGSMRAQQAKVSSEWIILYSDDFETDSFGWPVWDRYQNSGGYTWGRTNKKQFGGSYSLWCVGKNESGNPALDPTIQNYPPNMDAWAVLREPIDLRSCEDAEIMYQTWRRVVSPEDHFEVLAHPGNNDFRGHYFTSTSDGWDEVHLSFTNWPTHGNLIGQSKVYIALHFFSNSNSYVDRGVFLDNFIIRKKISGYADLSCSSFVFSPAGASGGEAITINAWFINTGVVASFETNAYYYLSPDAVISVDDYLIGHSTIQKLDPGESEEHERFFILPSFMSDGIYYIGYIIDRDAAVEESNETNNTGIATTPVVYGTVNVSHENTLNMPNYFYILQNIPNPFNPSTQIRFYMPEDHHIAVAVNNLKGQQVFSLFEGYLERGEHSVIWNGQNNQDTPCPSGIYLVTIESEKGYTAHKICLSR